MRTKRGVQLALLVVAGVMIVLVRARRLFSVLGVSFLMTISSFLN